MAGLKRFIRDVVLFLLGILILNALVYLVVSPLERDDSYLATVQGAPATTRGIVLADSHGTRLNSGVLGAAGITNFSTGSDSYVDMLNKLRYALGHYPIELVVLTADGHCMSKYREYTNNLDKSALLVGGNGFKAALLGYLPIVDPKGRDLFKGVLSARVSRALAPRAAAVGASAPSLAWKDKPNRKELSRRRADTQFKFGQPSGPLKSTLEEIVALCEARGVRLVGLKYPLAGDYLEAIEGKDYGAAKVLREAGIQVFDHEGLYAGQDGFFEDQDHLGPEGGAAFTRLLIEELGAGGGL